MLYTHILLSVPVRIHQPRTIKRALRQIDCKNSPPFPNYFCQLDGSPLFGMTGSAKKCICPTSLLLLLLFCRCRVIVAVHCSGLSFPNLALALFAPLWYKFDFFLPLDNFVGGVWLSPPLKFVAAAANHASKLPPFGVHTHLLQV